MKHLLSLAAVALLTLSTQAQELLTTFNVDMTCAPQNVENVFVTGPWCGWCANDTYNTMTDPDGDGIYTVAVNIEGFAMGQTVEYKYGINGFSDQENLVNDMVDGASCAPVTDFNGYANRQAPAGSIANDYYGTCDGTCNDEEPTAVTFRVDMSGYDGSLNPANVTWNSAANGWCGNCAPMEAEGEGIYALTVPLTGDTIEYKFAIGNWEDEEDLEPESDCVKTTYDEGAPNECCYVNRIVVLGGEDAIDMPVVCWNTCASCAANGCTDETACNYDPNATEDDGSCIYGDPIPLEFHVTDALCHDGTGDVVLDSATVFFGDSAGVVFSIDTLPVAGDTLTLAPGTYTLSAVDLAGCVVDSMFAVGGPDTLAISLELIAASPGMSDGQADATVAGGTPEYVLVWTGMNGTEVNPDSLSSGVYTLVVTDANGCTVSENFTLTTSSIAEMADLEGALFPVPVGDELNLRLAMPLNGTAQIQVHDAQGRMVAQTQMRQFDQNLTLDATSWTSGIYTLQMTTKEAIASWKFVK